MILKNTTESMDMVTLSFVMTGWGGKSATCSLSVMPARTRSMKGIFTCRPLFQVVRYEPRRSTMAACACGTILMHVTENSTTSTTTTTMAMVRGFKGNISVSFRR